MHKLFKGISKLYGVAEKPGMVKYGSEMKVLSTLENAWIWVENNRIKQMGTSANFDQLNLTQFHEVVDLQGAEVMPGFVDSHTHIVFASPRNEEFVMRIQGAGYEEIAEAGGGILNSARKLQLASEDELYHGAAERLKWMIAHGTTTVEIKSGYGLTLESELKMLRVIKRLKADFPVQVRATFLGAHAFPTEFKGNPNAYVQAVIEEMIPAVCNEKLADHIDVFCDRGYFTPEQTAQILEAAAQRGVPAKIHANELGITGGVQVAIKQKAWSADHLEYLGEEEFSLFAATASKFDETIPVGLPGCSFFLGIPFANIKKLIDLGCAPALATDFNPGSSPVCSLQMVWSLACTQMKLLPNEAFHAITCNAARSLRMEHEVGSLAPGMLANFVCFDLKDAVSTIPYFFGKNHAKQVFVNGELVAENGQFLS